MIPSQKLKLVFFAHFAFEGLLSALDWAFLTLRWVPWGLTRQALGVGATREALGGWHKVAPLYFSRNISAKRKRRDAKLCTHLPEYIAEVVCKFDADSISDDVTVTLKFRL